MSLVSVGELYRGLAHFGNIFGRQQPHAVNQCQIRHLWIFIKSRSQFPVARSFQSPQVLTVGIAEYSRTGMLWVRILA